MAFFTGSWILELTICIASVISVIYLYYQYKFRYWKGLGIPHTNPSFPLGDAKDLNFGINRAQWLRKLYEENKHLPFVGIWAYFRPVLLINDPEVVKTIFIKDFSSYQDRGLYVNEKDDPLQAHLFAVGGIKWRNLRAKMSPTFTSGKMKMMYHTLQECSEELKDVLQKPALNGEVLEVKDIAARFTTDIISSCAFGIKTNSLKNPDAIFRTMGRKIFDSNFGIVTLMVFFLPELSEIFKLVRTPREVTKFFMNAVKETMEYREKNNEARNDFMQLLIQLKNKGKIEDVDEKEDGGKELRKFTFEEAAAQAYVFYFAGFETSSTAMQFALYELSLNPDMQEKVREEVLKVLAEHNGEMSYEAIYSMDYLGRVIDETIRKYPPVGNLVRIATRDAVLNGKHIPKGTQVHIPIYGFHHDEKYFPDPEKFDPDRFLPEEKAKRHHFSYLPFGEGPRNCIGMRFGLMQSRVGLATLLSNFRFEVCEKTPIPLILDDKTFILSPKNGMYLRVTALKK